MPPSSSCRTRALRTSSSILSSVVSELRQAALAVDKVQVSAVPLSWHRCCSEAAAASSFSRSSAAPSVTDGRKDRSGEQIPPVVVYSSSTKSASRDAADTAAALRKRTTRYSFVASGSEFSPTAVLFHIPCFCPIRRKMLYSFSILILATSSLREVHNFSDLIVHKSLP